MRKYFQIKELEINLIVTVSIILIQIAACKLPAKETNIAFSLESTQSIYHLGETVEIKYIFTNNSKNEIIICSHPTTEDLTFIYTDNNKRETKKDFATFEPPISPNDFVTIKPGESLLIGTAQFDKTYFDKSGIWQIQIEREYNFGGIEFGLSGWMGSLKSNKLTAIIGAK